MSEEVFVGKRGTYKLSQQHPIAYGRTSVLYAGIDESGNDVCIKLFRDPPDPKDSSRSFAHEVQAQRGMSHPNILPVVDYGAAQELTPGPFLVMPLCTGGDLRSMIQSRDFVPLHEALTVLQQVAAAIDYAHRSGFIHGDIKPENILFRHSGSQPCLADFGVSRYFPFTERVVTMEGQERAGSTAYLSPEQVERNEISPRSDIYAFALVAYELLAGALPFDMKAPAFQLMKAKVEGKLADPRDLNPMIPAPTSKVLLKCLHTDPKSRPSSASEFCDALAISGQPASRGGGRRSSVWGSLPLAHRITLVAAIITAVGAIVAAGIIMIPSLLK